MPVSRSFLFALVALVAVVSGQQETPSRQYKCQEGWELFEEEGQCVLFSKQRLNFEDAKDACRAEEAELVTVSSSSKNDFIFPYVASGSGHGHWIGLEKGAASSYKWTSGKPMEYFDWGESPRHTVGEGCVFMDADAKWFSTPNCQYQKRHFICEKEPGCADGRFGESCEEECFCASKPCDPVTGECIYGCEPGWTGPKCDEPKELVNETTTVEVTKPVVVVTPKPVVKKPSPPPVPPKSPVAYYCVDSSRLGRYVYLRMDPKGAYYADVFGLQADGFPAPDCLHKEFSVDEETEVVSFKLNLTRMRQQQEQQQEQEEQEEQEGEKEEDENAIATDSMCGAEKTGPDTYTWRLWLQEVKGVLSAHDQVIKVVCNFSDAETMDRERKPVITNTKAPHLVEANQTKEQVELRLVDPYTGETVTETQLGTRLKIVMELIPQEGLAAKGISAFGCVSEDLNGTQRVELTDFDGCQVAHSPVSAMKGDGLKLESAIFPIFSFPKASDVTFQCGFEFCFEAESDMCTNRCDYKGKGNAKAGRRRYRRSLGGELKTLQTTVHILPGSLAGEDRGQGMPARGTGGLTALVFATAAALSCLALVILGLALRMLRGGATSPRQPATPPPQAV